MCVLFSACSFGDASLIRQANLYCNICQLGTPAGMLQCLGWISTESAKLLRLSNYGLEVGCWADFIVVNSSTPDEVIRDIRHPLMCFKRGQQTVQRNEATLLKPT